MTGALRPAEVRRIAVAAQGLDRPRPGRVDVRHLRTVLERLHVVQIDSVNVLARAHELPFFSRLGPYDRARLHRWLWRSGEVFEYLGHEAAHLPTAHHHLFRHRMATAHPWRRIERLEAERPGYVASVLDEVAERGRLTAADLSDGGDRSGPWWGLSPGKVALEHHYAQGRLAIAERRPTFVTVYDLPERVVPAPVLAVPTPPAEEARRALLELAARAHGVGTAADLADYHRLSIGPARATLHDLAAEGRLERIAVEGWREAAYLHPQARRPRRVRARALLAPFDPLVWFRPRAERVFGFRYRIEIYVPAAQRVHGYYVLPFLLDDRLVARVDLKADRATRRLLVRSVHLEPDERTDVVVGPLARELAELARWLDLDDVTVEPDDGAGRALRSALRST